MAAGARQFVVQLALVMMLCLPASYRSSFTPRTIVMSSPLAGALMITFFAPAVMWARGLVGVGEETGRLEHDVDAQVAPRQRGRIPLLEDLDLAAVDDQRVVGVVDGARVGAVGRVVLEEKRVQRRVDEVVDCHDLDVRASAR